MTGPALLALAATLLAAPWLAAAPAAAQEADEAEAAPAAEAGDAAAEAVADVTEADPAAIPDMALGSPDAPVTMIEYASFTCPHCAAFHAEQFQELKRDYIDTGRVRFVYREVYFDRFGLWASMIARCGDESMAPGRFFGIADRLFEEQREWVGDGEPAAIAENLRRIGLASGLDEAALDACFKDEDEARALLAWYEANAAADGVTATPTLLIDGEAHGNMPYDELKGVLDAALAE